MVKLVPPVSEPPLIPQTCDIIRPPGEELRVQLVASEAKPTPLTATDARVAEPTEGVTATNGFTVKLAVPLSAPHVRVTVTGPLPGGAAPFPTKKVPNAFKLGGTMPDPLVTMLG